MSIQLSSPEKKDPPQFTAQAKGSVRIHPDPEELVLYANFKGLAWPIADVPKELQDLHSAAHKASVAAIKTLDEGSSNWTIDWSSLALKYTDRLGKQHAKYYHQIAGTSLDRDVTYTDKMGNQKTESLSQLMAKIQRLAKATVQCCVTTNGNTSSNRPIYASDPLGKLNQHWIADHALALPDYLATNHQHLEAVLAKNHPNLAKTAIAKIVAADCFIESFKKQLEKDLKELQDQGRRLPEADFEGRDAIKREMRQIETQLDKFKNIDRKAIFWNVAHLNDEGTARPDLNELVLRSKQIRGGMRNHLIGNKDISGGFWKSSIDRVYIESYVNDVGDLLLHDRWNYESLLQSEDHREEKQSCAEEFVVFNIEQILSGMNDPNEALTSLSLPNGAESRPRIEQALKKATVDASSSLKPPCKKPPTG